MAKQFIVRQRLTTPLDTTKWANTPELIARLYAARGLSDESQIPKALAELIPPSKLGSTDKAAELIIQAITENWPITITGDYDCDGATGTAVMVRGLKLLGAKDVDFAVPNRFIHGYGLSPELVDSLIRKPKLIITVDSGVSSNDGVAHAKEQGIYVLVTDHHLPGVPLPDADVIVNPNLDADPFPSKSLAGVGVAFYVLYATYLAMRERDPKTAPVQIAELLDIVAIGTVADLVPLDTNNRILVTAGLRRVQQNLCSPGLKALIESTGRPVDNVTAQDVAFNIAPRINAAGRLKDMTVGVQCLIETDFKKAVGLAKQLEEINNERKEKQSEMVESATTLIQGLKPDSRGIVLYRPDWHSGIVGLVAARVKESTHRPTIAFAPAEPGSNELRGSARSIPGVHLRDLIALVAAENPGLIPKFGGHAMAAGLSLRAEDLPLFKERFEHVCEQSIDDTLLDAVLYVDGELPVGCFDCSTVEQLSAAGPWGQAFPEPCFQNQLYVEDYRVLGEKHLKLFLIDPRDGARFEGIYFNGFDRNNPPAETMNVVFELGINNWGNNRMFQLMVRYVYPS